MAIFTQHGEPVRIISAVTSRDGQHTVKVESLDDPSWHRRFNALTLKADGGWAETVAAINAAKR